MRDNLHERALSGLNNYSKFERSYITTAPHDQTLEGSPGKKGLDGDSNWNVVIDSDLAPNPPTANNGTNVNTQEPAEKSIFERLQQISKF